MDVIVIPGWVLSSIGGFAGFGILSGFLFKFQRVGRARRKEKLRVQQAGREAKKEQENLRVQQAEREANQKRFNRKRLLDRLLPGPWRTLYNFLHEYRKMTRQAVLMTAVAFERDIDCIPTICPGGFDLILEVSYYNLGGKGNCHEEFIALLGDHVKFPEDYGK